MAVAAKHVHMANFKGVLVRLGRRQACEVFRGGGGSVGCLRLPFLPASSPPLCLGYVGSLDPWQGVLCWACYRASSCIGGSCERSAGEGGVRRLQAVTGLVC